MAEKPTIEQVQSHCDKITQTPIDGLVTSADWGKINFEVARPSLEMIFGICHQLKGLPLEILPEQQLRPMRDHLANVATLVDRIRTFSVEAGNPSGARDEIANGLRGAADNLYVECQTRVPFLALQKGDVQRNVEALNNAVRQGKAVVEDAQQLVEAKKKEFDGIIAAAREASASVGVAHFTGDFSGEAARLEASANTWLKWTAGLGVTTALAAVMIAVLLPVSDVTVTPHVVQVMTTKLIVLGLLFTATIWCGRMYKAAKHQAAVNGHRANALKTFQAFVKAASDDATRNAVLLETTHSIFSSTATGYLDGGDDPSSGPTRVLEVVRAATETATKA